jgi:Ca2+-binding RTX toxin-like protein
MYCEDGTDSLTGGAQSYFLDGGTGKDTLNGGGGDDIFTTDGSDISWVGGKGIDTVNVIGNYQNVTITNSLVTINGNWRVTFAFFR